MSTIEHIFWFSYFNTDEPSVRYRAKYPLQFLTEKHGITYSLVYPGYDFHSIRVFVWTFFSVLFFRKKNSLIVYQKIYSKGIYAQALKILLRFRPYRTLYDMDDAEHTRRDAGTIHHFMKRCTACSVGSRSLREYALRFNPNVFLLTSPVIDHGLRQQPRNNAYCVGWIGYYAAHRDSLNQLFFPALRQLKFPIILKLLGVETKEEEQEIRSLFSDFPHITLEIPMSLNWQHEEIIYQHITSFTVGVSPLLDTEFNRGKSAFKLKQCLSCGVPVLASPVGENVHFLRDQLNGYFCLEPKDFEKKLTELYRIPQEHWKSWSQNALQTHSRFRMEVYGTILLEQTKSGQCLQA